MTPASWGDDDRRPMRWTRDTWIALLVLVASVLLAGWIEGRP